VPGNNQLVEIILFDYCWLLQFGSSGFSPASPRYC